MVVSNELQRLRRLNQLLAQDRLIPFLAHINPLYKPNWHHHLIANTIEQFIKDPKKKRLAIFVPPQHGKSEITSRALPAWILGRNPNLKVAITSYSAEVAKAFNRAAKQYISTREYQQIFPKTRLNNKRVDDHMQAINTSTEFEVVGHRGSLISVGITGGLTSKTVDLLIIDDPVKDDIEASSPVYRERAWNWYTSVSQTRLHNESKTLLIMTRWHEDDLGGRLMEKQLDKWEVLHLRAIKTKQCDHPQDPREVGQPLWPQRHDLERLMEIKNLSPSTFDSLYQGDPGDPSGNTIKKDWFIFMDEVPRDARIEWTMYIDGAYTKKTENDPTGIVVVGKYGKKLLVLHAEDVYMEMPELLKHISTLINQLGVAIKIVRVEPKASGLTLVQLLRSEQGLATTEIKNQLVAEGKRARLSVAAKWIEGGMVILVRAPWNDALIHQLTKYPRATHDEYVDLMGYACYDLLGLITTGFGIRKRN